MKKCQLLSFLVVLSLHVCSLHASLASITNDMLSSANKIRIVLGDSKVSQEKRDMLQSEYDELKSNDSKFHAELDRTKKIVKEHILDTKQALQKATSEFESQKFTLLNEYDQLLLDLGDARRQCLDITRQHIDYLDAHTKKDAADGGAKKSLYSFDDLHDLTKKITGQDESLYSLQVKKDDAQAMIDRLNSLIFSYDRQLKDAEQRVQDLKGKEGDIKEEIALLDLEQEVANLGKTSSSLQIDMHKKSIQFIDSRVSVIQNKLQILKNDVNNVRLNLRIDVSDVLVYEQKYNEIKRGSQVKKADLIKQRNELILQKKKLQDRLEEFLEESDISNSSIQQLEGWNVQEENLERIDEACEVALLKTSVTTLDRKLDQTQAMILLEDAKISKGKIEFDVISSLYSINQVQFKDNDYIETERELYKDMQNSLSVQLKSDKENISTAHGYIKSQHRALSNIKKIEDKIDILKKRAYRGGQCRGYDALRSLNDAKDEFSSQNSLSVKLSELYTQVMTVHEEALGTVGFIVKEFDLAGVWHRSNRAITWRGIKLVAPNLILFASHIKTVLISYFSTFTAVNIISYLKNADPSEVFSFLFILLLLFVLFVLLQTVITYVHSVCGGMIKEEKSTSFLIHLFELICGFLKDHFLVLYGWMSLWFLSAQYRMPIALLILLYVSSVAILISYSRLFLLYFTEANKKNKHQLLSKKFESRFSIVFSFFSISTVVILFLRKLFMLVMMYQQSEFPTILLRLYHVVVFVSLVFSIDKEELLQLFPEKGFVSKKIADFIDCYYSTILGTGLGLLVISDPYLGGYGSLVWHVVINSILTVIGVCTLFFSHKMIKRYSTIIFFKEDDAYESNIERFDYAKTWYAIYVVSLFGAYLLATLFTCSKIWGYGITYEQILNFLHYGVFKIFVMNENGTAVENYLTIGSILKIILTSLSGFLFAHLFNRFILKRIFDIQYVDPGVQNAVTTISRYFIIIFMIMVAFARADLGHLVTYAFGIGLLTFGWSFKDLFTDVVAYFFILVQRPIKLGDYVQLDDKTMGVVRKISPRAVILRRKNSVTIVVPNSQVLKTALYNWNYTRSFLAFDDIMFSVPFSADAVKVREVLFDILEKHPAVLKMPKSIVRLSDFGDKGYVFLVRGFLSFGNTLNQWDVRSEIRFSIIEELKKYGISVAEPVLRVNLDKDKGGRVLDAKLKMEE